MVNNAGLMRFIDLQDRTLGLENINREIATDLFGTIQMEHQFLPHLLSKASAGIVNVSLDITFMAQCGCADIQSATKAEVHANTQTLPCNWRGTNVKVFEMITPGVKINIVNSETGIVLVFLFGRRDWMSKFGIATSIFLSPDVCKLIC